MAQEVLLRIGGIIKVDRNVNLMKLGGVAAESEPGVLFSLKEVIISPEYPRVKEPFAVTGEVELFNIPFYGFAWVIITVVYPEALWEKIIPIIGSPEVRGVSMTSGGKFSVKFPRGFDREGKYSLTVRLYAGPSVALGSFVMPPFPPVATAETSFSVGGKVGIAPAVPAGEAAPDKGDIEKTEGKLSFNLIKPTPSPSGTYPGEYIKITCPVISECMRPQRATVRVIVYEGSAWITHGKLLESYESTFDISPGQRYDVVVDRTEVEGSTDRRDVEVEVYVMGALIKQEEWDDVYLIGTKGPAWPEVTTPIPGVAPARGSFRVYPPIGAPWAYYLWAVDWRTSEDLHLPNDVPPGTPIPFNNVLLEGEMAVWLTDYQGSEKKFGPAPKVVLKDGGVYFFNITKNTVTS